MGNKQSEKFFSYYHRWGEETLESSIRKCGFSTDDVTDVFLTHLHFDHCGGGVIRIGEDSYKTTFKMLSIGAIRLIGSGLPAPIKERLLLF